MYNYIDQYQPDVRLQRRLVCKRCGSLIIESYIKEHNLLHSRLGDETSIYELNLPVRVITALIRDGFDSIEKILANLEGYPYNNNLYHMLYDLRNVGIKTAEATVNEFANQGICARNGDVL